MQTFPSLYFRFSTQYPESGQRIQLGNSYQFDAPPSAPDQRVFKLTMNGMQYFLTPQGVVSTTLFPERNIRTLEEFYNRHKRAVSFLFSHPVYGQVTCKFNTPLSIPETAPGGMGVLPDFEVELIEIP